MTGDPVEDYLARLGRKLRGRDAELILAEAEDHLRETAAAGMAIGMTETEAAEAAVSAFGTVTAVVRAHRARTAGLAADLVLAAWRARSSWPATWPPACSAAGPGGAPPGTRPGTPPGSASTPSAGRRCCSRWPPSPSSGPARSASP